VYWHSSLLCWISTVYAEEEIGDSIRFGTMGWKVESGKRSTGLVFLLLELQGLLGFRRSFVMDPRSVCCVVAAAARDSSSFAAARTCTGAPQRCAVVICAARSCRGGVAQAAEASHDPPPLRANRCPLTKRCAVATERPLATRGRHLSYAGTCPVGGWFRRFCATGDATRHESRSNEAAG
jgi:hypothetical protein